MASSYMDTVLYPYTLLQLSQELYGSRPRRDFPNDRTGNSTVLRAAIVVDPAEPTQRFRPDCRKWAIRFVFL